MTPWSKVSQMDASHFDDRHRLRRHQPHPPRRPAASHLPHSRRRRHLAENRPRTARRPRQHRSRRSRAQRPSLRRHRTRRLRFVRRWRPLAVRCDSICPPLRSAISSIHDDDVVVGTHGRCFWILDDITPLRQLQPEIRPRPRTCSRRTSPTESAATPTPILRCRPRSPPGKIHPTAQSFITR